MYMDYMYVYVAVYVFKHVFSLTDLRQRRRIASRRAILWNRNPECARSTMESNGDVSASCAWKNLSGAAFVPGIWIRRATMRCPHQRDRVVFSGAYKNQFSASIGAALTLSCLYLFYRFSLLLLMWSQW